MIALGSASFISSARARVSAARIRQLRARLYHDDGDVIGRNSNAVPKRTLAESPTRSSRKYSSTSSLAQHHGQLRHVGRDPSPRQAQGVPALNNMIGGKIE